MPVPRPMIAAGVGCTLGAGGLLYRRHLSPGSQALGAFPDHGGRTGAVGTERRIALTFDDGPNEPYTSQVAVLLEDRGVRGSFFQVGRCVQRHPSTTRRLHDAGHLVGNHSWAHRFERCWRRQDVDDEVRRCQDAIGDVLGVAPEWYRPPWLARTAGTFSVLGQHGLQPVSGVFCHPLEPVQPDARRIATRALARARPGGVLIFHDGWDDRGGRRDQTVGAVALVLDGLLERGYQPVTVAELFAA